MSLRVYFDENLIDEQYYSELSNNFEMFNDSFKLGGTPSNTYVLKVGKEGVTTQPTNVRLWDNVTIAELKVDNIEEQDYEYVYTLTDKMVDLDFYYDASEIFQNGSTTLFAIVSDILSKVGLILGTGDFRGYNKLINWYDNTKTARQYIGYVAELNGGFARIEGNTLYFVKQNAQSKATIQIDDCEDFVIGERHQITRVVFEMGSLKYEFGEETGNTLYLDPENVFLTDQSEVEAIYNELNGFTFYSYETSNCPISDNVKTGDIIEFTDGTNSYPTIAQYDLEFFGGWIGGYSLSVNTERQEETQIIGNKENIRNLRITVDRQNNIIQQTVEEVGQQNAKISQVTQTVDELNSKIQENMDFTTSGESTYASVSLEGVNESNPITIRIHPLGENISYWYPNTGLFPSLNTLLKVRTLRFIRTYEEEGETKIQNIDYELPDDLLYYDMDNWDEFYYDITNETCQITKKCQYNADGTVSLLAEPIINTYEFPTITLLDGDYQVQILGYTTGYIFVRAITQNTYTSQFVTKAEYSSGITQTKDEINLSVDTKLESYPTNTEMNSAITIKANEITSGVATTYETKGNAQQNYSQLQQTDQQITSTVATKVGNNEIISKINQSSEAVTINANKISLAGKTINMTSDNVAINSTNFKVDKNGNMTCNNANVTGTIKSSNATITGGSISIKGTPQGQTPTLEILDATQMPGEVTGVLVHDDSIIIQNSEPGIYLNASSGTRNTAYLYCNATQGQMAVTGPSRVIARGNGVVEADSYQYNSLAELKKNIKKYNVSALKVIQNGEVYTYNFKFENDTDKKHIGFVIGENYKTPIELLSADNKKISSYDTIAILWKAIQEQQEEIELLKEEIKLLKEGK